MFSTQTRTTIISLVVAGGLIFLISKFFDKKKDSKNEGVQIPITDQNIEIVLNAYREALENNESVATLSELNKSLLQEFGMSVKKRPGDGSLVVSDMMGKTIKVV